MAITQLLAVGTTAADSADVVVAAGEKLSVGLNDAAGPKIARDAIVDVKIKDPVGQYFKIDRMRASKPALELSAGTYRFSRVAGGSCGVFSAH